MELDAIEEEIEPGDATPVSGSGQSQPGKARRAVRLMPESNSRLPARIEAREAAKVETNDDYRPL